MNFAMEKVHNKFILIAESELGNIKQVKELIRSKVDVNLIDGIGDSALIGATLHDHLNIVKFLIKNGAEINVKNLTGWNPLMYASMNGKYEISKLLIKNKANINDKDKKGLTALRIASLYDNVFIVDILLKAGAKMDCKPNLGLNSCDWTSSYEINDLIEKTKEKRVEITQLKRKLFQAIEVGDLFDVVNLVKKVTLNLYDEQGNNSLHLAAFWGNAEIFKFILSIRPDLIFEKNKNNFTPLELAIQRPGLHEIIKIIIFKYKKNSNKRKCEEIE